MQFCAIDRWEVCNRPVATGAIRDRFKMGKSGLFLLVVAAVAISGCTRTSSPFRVDTRTPPQALPSVPAGEVQTSQLDPIYQTDGQTVTDPYATQANPVPTAPTTGGEVVTDPNTSTAALSASTGTEPLSREALMGSWNVVSDNPACRAIFAFTKWDNGYRATTRSCTSPEISSITAWDVKGQEAVFVDQDGNTVARLYASGNDRFDGTTSSGLPVTLSR